MVDSRLRWGLFSPEWLEGRERQNLAFKKAEGYKRAVDREAKS